MTSRLPASSLHAPPSRQHHPPRAPPTTHPRAQRTTSTSTASTANEPPAAPTRPTARKLAASHLARRPPAYATARPVNGDDPSRRPPYHQGRTSPTAVRSRRLDVPSDSHFTSRALDRNGRSNSHNRFAEALHAESDGEVSNSSDEEILIPDSPGSALPAASTYGRHVDMNGMMDGTVDDAQGEWEDEREDLRIIEMWKSSKYRVDDVQLRAALEVSLREKVEGLGEDGWMFGDAEEDGGG